MNKLIVYISPFRPISLQEHKGDHAEPIYRCMSVQDLTNFIYNYHTEREQDTEIYIGGPSDYVSKIIDGLNEIEGVNAIYVEKERYA